MKDIANLSNDELDSRLLAQAKPQWQKVAMIVAKAMHVGECGNEERVTQRLEVLVQAGKLESAGNIQNWRSSEVRLTSK